MVPPDAEVPPTEATPPIPPPTPPPLMLPAATADPVAPPPMPMAPPPMPTPALLPAAAAAATSALFSLCNENTRRSPWRRWSGTGATGDKTKWLLFLSGAREFERTTPKGFEFKIQSLLPPGGEEAAAAERERDVDGTDWEDGLVGLGGLIGRTGGTDWEERPVGQLGPETGSRARTLSQSASRTTPGRAYTSGISLPTPS